MAKRTVQTAEPTSRVVKIHRHGDDLDPIEVRLSRDGFGNVAVECSGHGWPLLQGEWKHADDPALLEARVMFREHVFAHTVENSTL